MFVKYNGTNVHAMGEVGSQTTQSQSPQNVHWLRPGWNEFPKAVWDQNQTSPIIQKMIKKGTIEVMSEKATVRVKGKNGKIKVEKRVIGQDDKPIKVRYFDEKKAVEIVKATFNRDLLQRWLDEETRHKVKRAIDKQIKPLLNTEKEDEDDSEDSFDEEAED